MFGIGFAYFRLKIKRNDYAAIAILVVCSTLIVISQPGIIPYMLFFVIAVIAPGRFCSNPPSKLLLFSILLFMITCLIFLNCGFTVPIIRMFMYNNMFGMPMEYFVRVMGITDPALRKIVNDFVSDQSTFLFNYTKAGTALILCGVYAYLFQYAIAATVPGTPAPPKPDALRMPRNSVFLLLFAYAAMHVFGKFGFKSLTPGVILFNIFAIAAAALMLTIFVVFLYDYAGARRPSRKFLIVFYIGAFFTILVRSAAVLPPGNGMPLGAAGLVWSAIVFLYVIHGMILTYKFTSGSAAIKPFLLLLFIISFIIHELLLAMFVLGILDNLFGLRQFVSARMPGMASPKPAGSGRVFVFSIAVVTVAVIIAAWTLTSHGSHGSAKAGDLYPGFDLPEKIAGFSSEQRGNEVLVSSPKNSFFIDVYEHPNRKGAVATNNVTPGEAAAMCEAEGKRLCTAEEWAYACASGDNNLAYYLDKRKLESYNLVFKSCSWGNHKPLLTAKCGRYPKCGNTYGVHDMMGNLWEWVSLPGGSGMTGLAGPGENNGCQRCRRCDWTAVYFDEQIKLLDLKRIGFRCCRSASGN